MRRSAADAAAGAGDDGDFPLCRHTALLHTDLSADEIRTVCAMRKLRSDITREGLTRTPHRAFMRAMGLDDAAIARPMVGVVSMKGEQTPCNMTHDFQVAAAKTGIE